MEKSGPSPIPRLPCTAASRKEWLLIVTKQVGQFGTEYDEKQDLGRVKMTLAQTPPPVERFKIDLLSTGGNQGLLNQGLLKMTWERADVPVPIPVQ